MTNKELVQILRDLPEDAPIFIEAHNEYGDLCSQPVKDVSFYQNDKIIIIPDEDKLFIDEMNVKFPNRSYEE